MRRRTPISPLSDTLFPSTTLFRPQPGSEGAIHKLVSVRNRQRLSEFMIDIEGVSGVRWDEQVTRKEDWATSWLTAPTGRIAGGADEMLLNTIDRKSTRLNSSN